MTVTDVRHPTTYQSVSDRVARGKRARETVPRRRHGEWAPASGRPDALSILERQELTRVPDLVPIRHGRMAASAFAYFRGAAAVMASDLGSEPRSGLDVQLCGDAHLVNFGGFAAPDRTWCSTSTTSTRHFRDPSNGTSRGWPRASRSPPATARCAARSARKWLPPGRAGLPARRPRVRRNADARRLVLEARSRRHGQPVGQ